MRGVFFLIVDFSINGQLKVLALHEKVSVYSHTIIESSSDTIRVLWSEVV